MCVYVYTSVGMYALCMHNISDFPSCAMKCWHVLFFKQKSEHQYMCKIIKVVRLT